LETVKGSTEAAWEVEKILGSRLNMNEDGRVEFEAKWKGFEDCT
jgi:hypothetical protein